MRRKKSAPEPPRRAAGWMAYERHYGRAGAPSIVIKADGEAVPLGYGSERPATQEEIGQEQVKRAEAAKRARLREEFAARPEYDDAHAIRSVIELMEYDNHPLDRLTPDEWKELRKKICGH